MAEMTLQPTDIEILEEWLQAWRFAVSVLHMVSAKAMGVPSTDLEYRQLLQEINDVLYAKTGGALYYGAPAPIVDASTEILMAVKGIDPSQTALIGASPVTDVTTTAVEVGGAIATTGAGLFSKVGRKILISSIVACLGLEVFAGLLPQEQKTDLYTSLDPYADEDGNVLVHTDSDGTTRVPKSYIEAVRGKLVAMGAYDTGEPECDNPPEGSGTTFNNVAFPVVKNTTFNSIVHDGVTYYYDPETYEDQGNGKTYLVTEGQPTASTSFISVRGQSTQLNCIFEYDLQQPKEPNTGAICIYNNGEIFVRGISSGGQTQPSYTYDNKTSFYSYVMLLPTEGRTMHPIGTYNPNSVDASITGQYAWLLRYGSFSGGGGVEGITPQPDAVLPSDMSIDIADYMPEWSTDKKTFKAVSYDEDRHIEGLTDIDFYPVTLTGVNGDAQDITTPQDDAITGDAPSDADMEFIFPAIQDFYEFIHNYPNYPDIVIPAGDSGDTPPEEPPLIDAAGNGLWAIYNPTLEQVNRFGRWLWSSSIIDQIVRMFNSPLDAVIGFHMIYCTPINGTPQNIMCGYLDSEISSDTVANQYVTIDCGTVEVPEYYGTALDYTATRLSLYLPFIGFVPLSTPVCMGSTLSVVYRVDVLTGTCLAQVKVIKENSEAVMYTFPGNCSVQVPLTATTYTGMVSTLVNGVQSGLSLLLGDVVQAAGEAGEAISAGMKGLSGTKQSGSLGANAGVLGIRIPYLVITHPVAYDAFEYSKQYGYPLNETVTLGSLSGYTKIKDIHLQGVPCTDDELEMIERLLKDGVIIN